MKKATALILVILMVLSLAACGGGGSSDGGKEKKLSAAEDKSVMAMSFTAPETYETVQRFTEMSTDGTVTEKNITYNFADESQIDYAAATGLDISKVISMEGIESYQLEDKTFYLREDGKSYQAFTQIDDVVYAINFTSATEEGDSKEAVNNAIAGISFTDSTETTADDTDLYDIQYTIDEALTLSGYSITLVENPDGEVVKKGVVWKFGEDPDNLDFRFLIRVYKNTTVADVISEDKEYEEKTIGDLTYTVLKAEEGKSPYEYYTQHGEDVYLIRNNGSSNGWFVSRSEESETAFEQFLNSVSFK